MMATIRSTVSRWALACGMLAGCVVVRSPDPGERLDLGSHEVLVFGRLRVADHGFALFPPRLDLDPFSQRGQVDFRLSLFQVETGRKAFRPAIEEDGTFWWVLPAGTYLVFHTLPGAIPRNEVLAGFHTPADARAVYVGILELDIASDPHTGPPAEYTVDRLWLGDEIEAATAAFRARHPDFAAPLAKALLFSDGEFPTLFDDYSRSRCERILARHGVRPLEQPTAPASRDASGVPIHPPR